MPENDDWMVVPDDGFIAHVGPIYHKPFDASGVGRFRFVSDQRHRNRGGMIHGGMLATFADRALGMTARQKDGERAQVTVQLDMHYVSAAQMGETLDMHCRIVRQARTLIFLDGEIHVGERIVATARGVWKILREFPSP